MFEQKELKKNQAIKRNAGQIKAKTYLILEIAEVLIALAELRIYTNFYF